MAFLPSPEQPGRARREPCHESSPATHNSSNESISEAMMWSLQSEMLGYISFLYNSLVVGTSSMARIMSKVANLRNRKEVRNQNNLHTLVESSRCTVHSTGILNVFKRSSDHNL